MRRSLACSAGHLLLFLGAACQSAYYATLERFGVHKRDILVARVEDARAEQEDAKEQFQTTYQAFQALTAFEGGDLEALYERLDGEYQESAGAAQGVRERIASVEKVSKALFEEWDSEIEQITDPELRAKSRDLERDTAKRYEQLMGAMRAASERLDPVLKTLRNDVLFLQHELSPQAISSLKDTTFDIEQDVSELIGRMQASIDEANAFIASMG